MIQMQAMIDEFDRDQDGEINEQEFMYIMRQTSVYQLIYVLLKNLLFTGCLTNAINETQ